MHTKERLLLGIYHSKHLHIYSIQMLKEESNYAYSHVLLYKRFYYLPFGTLSLPSEGQQV